MSNPTDQDTKLAEKLLATEGLIERRDAIACALADAFSAGRDHGVKVMDRGLPPERDPTWRDRRDAFAAAAIGGLVSRDKTTLEDDAEDAYVVADLMLSQRQKGNL